MKHIVYIMRLCVIGWVVWMGSLACKQEKTAIEPIIRPVRSIEVYASGGNRNRKFSGVARAGVASKLSFKVNGTANAIKVKVGDQIKDGQLIAKLDENDYKLQVQQAEAALSQSVAQERNAKSTFDRVQALYENRNASKSDLEAARTGYESAKAAVKSNTQMVEMAKLQLSYTQLKAPVAGSIASVNIEVNENVRAGQIVAVLTSGNRPEVEVAVPELLIGQIKEGATAIVTFDAIPNQKFDAKITEVGIASMSFATTFPVTVCLNSDSKDIRPGMTAEVEFQFESTDERERFWLPPFAVGEDAKGRFVFLVESKSDHSWITHRQNVRIGELTDHGLEILEGLKDGDRVVTAGVSRIHDGLSVKLLEPTSKGASH